MDIHVYLHADTDTRAALARFEQKLDLILTKEVTMAGELNELQQKVAANGDVTQSAITLLQGLKAKLDEAIASGDPAALQALSDSLGAQDQALADAITQNTPSA